VLLQGIPIMFRMNSSLYARGCLTKFIIGSQHLGREVDRLSYCHLSMVEIILANISTQGRIIVAAAIDTVHEVGGGRI